MWLSSKRSLSRGGSRCRSMPWSIRIIPWIVSGFRILRWISRIRLVRTFRHISFWSFSKYSMAVIGFRIVGFIVRIMLWSMGRCIRIVTMRIIMSAICIVRPSRRGCSGCCRGTRCSCCCSSPPVWIIIPLFSTRVYRFFFMTLDRNTFEK